ncbi:hypothetical protein K440DRAFT_525221, partial [Wilcoxina mikolae CBS 423.85]
QKGMMIAFFHCLGTICAVAKVMGRPWSTIKNLLTRATQWLSIDNLPQSGRPEILTRRDKRAILKAARKIRSLTNEELRQLHAPHVSGSTIKRNLREHNI